jgi:signal transduction histidine kinase
LGGYAHAIVRRPDDSETVRSRAEIITSEIGRLEELLDDLLDLARPHEVAKIPGNLHEVLDRACLLACDNWAEQKILLRKDYDAALPPLSMNASALLRAFLNVTRNAMQAMPEGGSLTILSRCTHHEVVVTISDTGKGIPPDELPGIWTPFVTHRERGTGLGLPVTQQIVTEHGGSIEVTSEEGQGTSFIFHFSLDTEAT